MIYYLKLWWKLSIKSFSSVLSQKGNFLIFFLAKSLRFGIFFLFLYSLLGKTESLAGYNLTQTLFFFLTFNLVDVVSQFLFREVYRFRPLVVQGGFDLILTKPTSALSRVLLGGADVIDLATIIPLIIALFLVGASLSPSMGFIFLYILLLLNGLLIASAFHIFLVSLAIITYEIDHSIIIYRDLTKLGRFPIEIYKEPVRSILTFVIPVGVMVSVPVKTFLGIFSPQVLVLSIILGVGLFFASLKTWKFALSRYTSASS